MDQYIGRIVVLLTPVLAGLAGWIATRAADILPGNPDLDEAELTAIFVAGALALGAAVFKWLDNRGDYEIAELNRGAAYDEPSAPLNVPKK